MARLRLFLEEPFDNPLLMKKQTQAVLEALIQRQADEFQTAFKSFLSRIPWEDQLKNEACCGTVFLTAVAMAGRECDVSGRSVRQAGCPFMDQGRKELCH
jgi:hypothetical protein